MNINVHHIMHVIIAKRQTPGPDGILNEMILCACGRGGGLRVMETLTQLMNLAIWNKSVCP